ncbi:MAG: hypothetical protein GXO61_00750 [Epsilonproteobacteria bacterium]|nr:hypothetical protein [Campylobacterota bacterium]
MIRVLYLILLGLVVVLGFKTPPLQPKKRAVALITLPDLAISTEAHFIRHRTLSTLFDVFGISPSLPPYFPSDFVYAPPPYLRANGEIR